MRLTGRWLGIGLVLVCSLATVTAQTVYLEAEFDDGVCYSGEGLIPTSGGLPPECGGEWSQGAESGVGPAGATADALVTNVLSNPPTCDPPGAIDSSVYIHPDHGLRGSSQGLRLEDENCGSTRVNLHPTGAAATASQSYWIDYSFKLNPAKSGIGDALGWLQVYDANGNEVVRLWHGLYIPNTLPEFRYKFFLTPDPGATSLLAGNIAPTNINTEWRALIEIDPVAGTQTHRLWLEGNAITGFVSAGEEIFGQPHPLRVLQDSPLATVRFRSNSNVLVDFFVDEVRVTSEPSQTIPVDLSAAPSTLGQVQLNWSNLGGGEVGFIVERSPAGMDLWSVVANPVAGAVAHVDTPGAVAEKFDYRVAADYGGGSQSPWTNVASAVPVYRGKPLYGWKSVDEFLDQDLDHSDPANADATTAALQAALDAISRQTAGPHVLYFPDGVYAINSTLALYATAGAQVVGESTDGVVLRWYGPLGTGPTDTVPMIHSEGNRDAVFRNMTWDASCYDGLVDPPTECFVVAFDMSYCGNGSNFNPECAGLPWGSPGGSFANNGSAIFDSVFENGFIGLRISHYQVQDSETTIRRCRFTNNFVGSSVEDFNALDIWYWDSIFEDNWVGISNDTDFARYQFDSSYAPATCTGGGGESCFFNSHCPSGETCRYPGFCTGGGAQVCLVNGDCPAGESCGWGKNWAGDFDVYRGRFYRSRFADIFAQPTGQFTFRDSWSRDSELFFFGAGLNGTASQFALYGNLVEDATGPVIDIRNPGTVHIVDNALYNDGVSPPVVMNALRDLDMIALSNAYTVPVDPTDGIPELTDGDGPYQFLRSFRLRAYGDSHVDPPAQGDAFVIPGLPARADLLLNRDVYTVTDAALAQTVIDAALANSPAVVHFPSGTHDVDQTLQIPAGSDVILTGDGMWTRLTWTGATPGPMLHVDSENADRVIVQDIQLLGAGIVIENLARDLRGLLNSRMRLATPGSIGVLLNTTESVKTDFLDYMGGGSVSIDDVGSGTSVDQVGFQVRVGPDPVDPAEKETVGFFSGSATGNGWDYDVVNDVAGASVMIADTYMEDSRHYLRVRGAGGDSQVEIFGGKLAPIVALLDPAVDEPDIDPDILAEETATILVDGYDGNVSLSQSLFFVQPSASKPCCSDNVASAYGARIKVLDATPVEIQFLGATLRHHATPIEYDFTDAGGQPLTTVDFLRIGGKIADPSATQITDARVTDGTTEVEVLPGDDVRADLEKAVELRRTVALPHYHDEPGAPDDYKVIVDNVFLWDAPDYSLLATGGEACFDATDCVDGPSCATPSCDLADLPAGVPGHCRYTPDDGACDDQISCTTDTCDLDAGCLNTDNCPAGLLCHEQADQCDIPCDTEADCDDGLSCTLDLCLFHPVPIGEPSQGFCKITDTCNDGDLCTVDTCGPAGCGFTPACDDGDACTVDTCDPGTGDCGTLPTDCDDGITCTFDSCDSQSGCSNDPVAALCDDGIACTIDDCDPLNGCEFTPDDAACDDGRACTADICDPVVGCQFVSVTCDTVTITKASYKNGPRQLEVWAVSDQQPGPTLTVVGFGEMTYKAPKNRYELKVKPVPNPGTVTVVSSAGGSDTATVD